MNVKNTELVSELLLSDEKNEVKESKEEELDEIQGYYGSLPRQDYIWNKDFEIEYQEFVHPLQSLRVNKEQYLLDNVNIPSNVCFFFSSLVSFLWFIINNGIHSLLFLNISSLPYSYF